jgi:hypothetical protein
MTNIIAFYTGGADNKGRTLDDMIALNDPKMEAGHDFIQWMFPLHEKSLHSVNTPVLTQEDIDALKASPVAKANMLRAFARFKDFLGVDGDERKFTRWARTGDHNLLRITRVIRSLRLFGFDKEAKDFHSKVTAAAKRFMVTPVTVEFWNKALNDDLGKSMTKKFLQSKRIDL